MECFGAGNVWLCAYQKSDFSATVRYDSPVCSRTNKNLQRFRPGGFKYIRSTAFIFEEAYAAL
ncbi:hypothetical protein SAMN04487941_2731 [Pontibacter akesuensis]|uniref:Uncharacterized protein n=1 Tax=Pontibacter akesuensis TaxID=388950 RepID=A0A1I7JD01_9BACT|nr:hypothetical protein SAMN04487941_2731 [Pontibacter akesuensis]